MTTYKLEAIKGDNNYVIRRMTHAGSIEKVWVLVAKQDTFHCNKIHYNPVDCVVMQGNNCQYTFTVSLY